MVRPGVNVLSRATPPASTNSVDRGRWFLAQVASEGPANTPLVCHNLTDFTRQFGPRDVASPAYDALDTFFREGGSEAYFSRIVGPAPVTATLALLDRAGAPLQTLRVNALGPGVYGATISIQVQNGVGANTFNILVWRNGAVQEQSPDLASPTDAVAWATGSQFVRIVDLASATAAPNNNPAVLAATPLAGAGITDDRANITDVQRTTAINSFGPDLGVGQISIPGGTTATIHTALRTAARATNRQAILDLPDTAVVATLTGLVNGVNEEYSATFGPWVVVPGVVPNTTRIVPPSALVAGLIARGAALGQSPNRPVAGANGAARYALGVTQNFIDVDRQTLNGVGVNVVKMVYGEVRLYGFRTNANPVSNAGWVNLGNQLLREAITDEVLHMGEHFEFGEIDGRGHLFAEFGGASAAIVQRYYDEGSIFGDTPDDAYLVDTGPAVNTPVTIANNELHVVVACKMSPMAEMVQFEIVKLGIADTI